MNRQEKGLLILRVFFGIAFVIAGFDKLLRWGDVSGMFGMLFGSAGAILAGIVLVIEIFGGLALVLGFHTRKAAWLLAVVIAVAFLKTFGVGDAPNLISTLRELLVMNTGKMNDMVNFQTSTQLAYLAGLVTLGVSGSKLKAMKAD